MITVIANLKGGTGKSTVTFNLAVWLCSRGIELTVIDLDPQRTLTDVAALRLEEGLEPPIHVQSGPFSSVRLPGDTDETLIDVGTADLDSFKQALRIADRVLIPVTPSQADVWSTQRFVQFLYKITEGNPPESIAFINRADINRAIPASDEAAAALTSLPGVRLVPQRLSDRTVFRNSFSEGLAVFELEPRSRGSLEFKALAAALFSQKHRVIHRRPQEEKAPHTANTSDRIEAEAAADDKNAARRAEYDLGESRAPTGEGRDLGEDIGEKKKKHGAKEGKKAGKREKRKNRKKAMKETQAGKGGKGGKGKKDGKAKKGKKRKKGKKAKKSQ
ncbi:MAG: AAA family ATPase [Gammaproteobacteria bacterium]|nr:AAA family ATPase [Gammaproteobacteria bacterium]